MASTSPHTHLTTSTRPQKHQEPKVTTEKPAVIVNVSLAGSDRDYDRHVTFLNQEFHLRRI